MKTIIPCFVIAVMAINSLAITPFAFAMTANYQPKISFIDSQDDENHWSLPPPLPKPQGSQKIANWYYGENDSVQIVIEGGDGINKRYNKPFNSSIYPLSAIGVIDIGEPGENGEMEGCTGFLIGPREVITAAHCVQKAFRDGKKGPFAISLNPFGHRGNGHKYPLFPVFGGWNSKNGLISRGSPANDWYLLRSRENIGEKFGWLGLKNSNGETIPPSQKISAQAQEELKPYLRTSSDVLKNIKEIRLLDEHTFMENSEKTRVVGVGFHGANFTRDDRGHILNMPMSISNCHIMAYTSSAGILNNCSGGAGGSGGPILEITDGHAYALGVYARAEASGRIDPDIIISLVNKIYKDLEEHKQPTVNEIKLLALSDIYLSIPTSKDEVSSRINEFFQKNMIEDSTPGYFQFTGLPLGGLAYEMHALTDNFFDRVRDYLNQTYNRYTAVAEECDWNKGFCFGTNWKTATPVEAQGINVRAKDQRGETPLHWAAWHNENIDTIAALIQAGADIHAKDNYENTPLHFAALKNKNLDIIAALIQAGADIHAKDNYRDTPLHLAAWNNKNLDIIAALIQAGADIHAKGKYGRTPLHYAARYNENPDIITALIQAGSDIHAINDYGSTPLHLAAWKNKNLDIITALIQAGADIHAKSKSGHTPLHLAAQTNKNPDIIAALIQADADIHAKDNGGNTPLHEAAEWNKNPDIIAALIQARADINAKDNYRDTPLHEAVRFNKNPDIITALKQAGADINAENNGGYKPYDNSASTYYNYVDDVDMFGNTHLHSVVGNNMPSFLLAAVIQQAGAHINAVNIFGYTPLHAATSAGTVDRDALSLLIQASADINAKAKGGETPLHSAARFNTSSYIITDLIQAGADIHAKNEDGYTPLHFAAYYNENPDIITALIQAGADTHAVNNQGETAEDIARKRNKLDLYQEAVRKALL